MLPVVLKGAEVIRRRHNAKVERRLNESESARNWRMIRKVGAGCIAIGALMAFTDSDPAVVEMSANGGTAKVFEINRTLSEHHVIGFKTEVDGATAERKLTNRKVNNEVAILNAIPLPDIIANVRMDDFVVSSDLCYKGGEKSLKEYEVDGVTNIDYEVDLADLRVCSAEDVNYTPKVHHDGNWIQNMNDADAELGKIGGNGENTDTIRKSNEIKESVRKLAQNAALLTVNRKCAPQVFDATKEDFKEQVAKDIARPGEVVHVTFKEGSVFEGQSEVDDFFNQRKKEETDQLKYNFDGGIAGTCTLADEFIKQHVPTKENAGA
ncbi:MAG TPA: hypothetical protein VF281_01325 [Candidatus Saccharimonadales bacterium]